MEQGLVLFEIFGSRIPTVTMWFRASKTLFSFFRVFFSFMTLKIGPRWQFWSTLVTFITGVYLHMALSISHFRKDFVAARMFTWKGLFPSVNEKVFFVFVLLFKFQTTMFALENVSKLKNLINLIKSYDRIVYQDEFWRLFVYVSNVPFVTLFVGKCRRASIKGASKNIGNFWSISFIMLVFLMTA